MIKLPKFDTQSMYDYETNFHLTANEERMSKLITHYEAFKLSQNIPGEIVECGVFKGASLIRFLTFRDLIEKKDKRKIIGFDAFGKFPRPKNDNKNKNIGVSINLK